MSFFGVPVIDEEDLPPVDERNLGGLLTYNNAGLIPPTLGVPFLSLAMLGIQLPMGLSPLLLSVPFFLSAIPLVLYVRERHRKKILAMLGGSLKDEDRQALRYVSYYYSDKYDTPVCALKSTSPLIRITANRILKEGLEYVNDKKKVLRNIEKLASAGSVYPLPLAVDLASSTERTREQIKRTERDHPFKTISTTRPRTEALRKEFNRLAASASSLLGEVPEPQRTEQRSLLETARSDFERKLKVFEQLSNGSLRRSKEAKRALAEIKLMLSQLSEINSSLADLALGNTSTSLPALVDDSRALRDGFREIAPLRRI